MSATNRKPPPAVSSPLPDLLRRRLAWRQCVAYVGAGFSMACGMPHWAGLLGTLVAAAERAQAALAPADDSAALCRNALAGGRYAMAASLLRKLFSPSDLDEAIRQQFGDHVLLQAAPPARESMEARMEHLVRGPWAGIVTTNYDTLVERAIGRWVQCETVMVSGDDPRLGTVLATAPAGGFFFVKIHGSISGSRVVLSSEEYDRTYLGTARIASFLSALMLRYFVVFIGCSMEDEIVRIRRKLALDFEGMIPPAYALLPETHENRERASWLREAAKVECLLYAADGGDHRVVERFLAEAAACTDPATAKVPAGELTRAELAALAPADRLKKVGRINRELLELISGRPNRTLDHIDLVELNRLEGAKVSPGLIKLSAEERVYRVLFLVSISLVTEKRPEGGSVCYQLSPQVADVLPGDAAPAT